MQSVVVVVDCSVHSGDHFKNRLFHFMRQNEQECSEMRASPTITYMYIFLISLHLKKTHSFTESWESCIFIITLSAFARMNTGDAD